MSHTASPDTFDRQTAFSTASRAAASPPSLFSRFINWMVLSRERQSQRDLDRLVSWRDGNFSDSLEREIAERSYSDGWNFRQ